MVNLPVAVSLYAPAIIVMHAEVMQSSAFVFPNTDIDDVQIVVELMDSQINLLWSANFGFG